MYRKVFIVVLVLLMFVNVPVYANNEVYTLEQGKVYRFKNGGKPFEAEFSDYVLSGSTVVSSGYTNVYHYSYSDNMWFTKADYPFVYNCNNKTVTMTVYEGNITEVDVFASPFSIVMYDGSETDFKMTNNTEYGISYKRFEYNEVSDSLDNPSGTETLYTSGTYTGRGVILLPVNINELQDTITFEGDYEAYNYIRLGFFQGPPWILKTDLAGIIRAFLEQLSMVLPVALVILSVFLLISLAKYIVRSFL